MDIEQEAWDVDPAAPGAPEPALVPMPPEPPATSVTPRAWVVAFEGLGLINVVGTSQSELAGRLASAHATGERALVRLEVVAHAGPWTTSVAWVDPGLVQAVLNEFTKPALVPAPAPTEPSVQAVVVEEPRHE